MSKQDKRIRKEGKSLYQIILAEVINPKLTMMENYVREQLEKMSEQQKKINGFVVGEVKFVIAKELDDAKVTREALIEILNEKLGIEGLTELVLERKATVRKRLIVEAEAKMKAQQEEARARAEAEDKAKAEAQAPAQPPQEPPAPTAPVQE